MIGYLRGKLHHVGTDSIILDTNGIGYEVYMPLSAIQQLPNEGASVELFTHLNVREDAHTLYGFTKMADRDMFRVLISVSHIGPRIALAILEKMSVANIVESVELNDDLPYKAVSGVGKKTAERLLIELRDKVQGFSLDSDSEIEAEVSAGSVVREATEALVELGFSNREARQAALSARNEGAATTEQIVREALSRLSVKFS